MFGAIWKWQFRGYFRFITILTLLTTFLVIYPSFVTYHVYDLNGGLHKKYSTYTDYLDSVWKVHNVRSFIKTNIALTLKFHVMNLWLFVGAAIKWFSEEADGFFNFIFYQTIIYYFLMIYGLVYGFCGFLNASDIYNYPKYYKSMRHWYLRIPIYILYFMMILNTVSLIIAIAIIVKAKSQD